VDRRDTPLSSRLPRWLINGARSTPNPPQIDRESTEDRQRIHQRGPNRGRLISRVPKWAKTRANVRSKSRPKRGPKGTSKSKKSRKTSKSEIENWPKKGQKWTSKTAPKIEGRDPPRIHLKLTTNRPEIDQYRRQIQEC
jgi:hypothetical protein